MGEKLTIYLVDGLTTGSRIIKIGNWSGKAIYSPRASLLKIMERSEFNRPGIYLLKFNPDSSNYNERIYIGEAENVRGRLKQHLSESNKDFIEVVTFVNKGKMLTKSNIKHLEAKLIF